MDVKSHIRTTILGNRAIAPDMGVVIGAFYKQRLASGNLAEGIPHEVLIRIEVVAARIVENTTSWKSEKKQRAKSRSELQEFFEPMLGFVPDGSPLSAIRSIMPSALDCIVEVSYQAILSRAGRDFAVAAVIVAITALIEFPRWLSDQLSRGNLTWSQ